MNQVSRIISGTMTWGAWGKALNTKEMIALMEEAMDLGIHTFDHADIYGGYTTERDFGLALAESGMDREKMTLISKCGIQMPCEARPLNVKHYDYSAKHIRMSVENSLRNLNTDYLDVLLLHRPSPLMHVEEIADVVQKLQEQGKIKTWGVSNFTITQMALLQRAIPLAWNQIECSLTHYEPLFDGILDRLQEEKIGVMAWSPLGSYFKKDNQQKDRLNRPFPKLCEKYNCTEDQLLIAWLLYHPANIYPVVGTTEPKRLAQAVAAEKITLDIQDWFILLEASMGKPLP